MKKRVRPRRYGNVMGGEQLGDTHLRLFVSLGRGVIVSSASAADLAVHVLLLICRHCRRLKWLFSRFRLLGS